MILLTELPISSDMLSFIVFMVVVVLATSMSKIFLERFDFDFIVINTGIFLIFLAFTSVIDEYYIGVGLLILGGYLYFIYKGGSQNGE